MIKKVFGFLAALALFYGAAWLSAAFWLRARIDTFAADLTARGYTVERTEPRFVGFPTSVGLKFTELSVTAPTAQGGWRWKALPVTVALRAGAPTEPVVDLAGVQTVTGLVSAPNDGLALNVGQGRARLTFAPDQSLENIVLELADTTVAAVTSSETLFSVKDSSLHLSLAAGHLAWRLDEIGLPKAVPALGQTIRKVDIAVDVVGPFPGGPLKEALEAWRDGGGAIEVRSFVLDWPPASAAGTATLALDGALQPMGAATIKFLGFFDIVAALQAKGQVHEREATMAKIMLGMLARPSASGLPELSLPVTVQDRKLSAGPVPLMDMPEVIWDHDAKVP